MKSGSGTVFPACCFLSSCFFPVQMILGCAYFFNDRIIAAMVSGKPSCFTVFGLNFTRNIPSLPVSQSVFPAGLLPFQYRMTARPEFFLPLKASSWPLTSPVPVFPGLPTAKIWVQRLHPQKRGFCHIITNSLPCFLNISYRKFHTKTSK